MKEQKYNDEGQLILYSDTRVESPTLFSLFQGRGYLCKFVC